MQQTFRIDSSFIPGPGVWRSQYKTTALLATGYRIERNKLSEALKTKSIADALSDKCGVYVLTDDKSIGTRRAYIGQADKIDERLKQHDKHPKSAIKDWSVAIVFVDKYLDGLKVEGLEHLAIKKAKESGTYTLANGNVPKMPGSLEDELPQLNSFFGYMESLASTLGVPYLFVSTGAHAHNIDDPSDLAPSSSLPSSGGDISFTKPTPISLSSASVDVVDLHKRYSPMSILVASLSIFDQKGKLSATNLHVLLSGGAAQALSTKNPTIKHWKGATERKYTTKVTLCGKPFLVTSDVHDYGHNQKISNVLQWSLDNGLTALEIKKFCEKQGFQFRHGFVPASNTINLAVVAPETTLPSPFPSGFVLTDHYSPASILAAVLLELEARHQLSDSDIKKLKSGAMQTELYSRKPTIIPASEGPRDKYTTPLLHNGKKYLITSDVYPRPTKTMPKALVWAHKKGFEDSEIAMLCTKHGLKAKKSFLS